MVRNTEKYQLAVDFRARGFTLAEIAKICDVSKSTVSKWLKNSAISADVTKQNKTRAGQENAKRLRLINKARSTERKQKYQEVESAAKHAYKHFREQRLFVAGMTLFLAQGSVDDEVTVRFSTADAWSHAVFISFLVEYAAVPRETIRVWLQLYPAHNEEKSLKHWKRITKLPFGAFGKTQYVNSRTKRKPLHNGVGNTIIGSTVLQRKLTVWSQMIKKDLI